MGAPATRLRCRVPPARVLQAGSLVEATLDLYRKVTSEMLPSPTRPHYVFSIRHVSQVFQVGLMAPAPTPQRVCVRVWRLGGWWRWVGEGWWVFAL